MFILNGRVVVWIFIFGVIGMVFVFPWIKKIYLRYTEIIHYLIVGVLTTILSLILYYGLVFTILNPENAIELQIANVLSWIGSVLFAYITNRKYVFQSKNENQKKEFVHFIGSRIMTLFFDMFIMFLGVTILSISDKLTKLISQIVVIIANYVLSKLFVFNKQKNKGKK